MKAAVKRRRYQPRKLLASVNFLGRTPVTITFRDLKGVEFAQCDVSKKFVSRYKPKENSRDHFNAVFTWRKGVIVKISLRHLKPRKLTKKDYERVDRELQRFLPDPVLNALEE